MRRQINVWTNICGRRNADEYLRNEEMWDEDLSGYLFIVPAGAAYKVFLMHLCIQMDYNHYMKCYNLCSIFNPKS